MPAAAGALANTTRPTRDQQPTMTVPRVAPEPRGRGRAVTVTAAPPDGEKLHKVLARAGLGSRRELEHWIEQGRVTVNGKAAAVGDRVGPTAAIRVDGHPVTVVPAAQRRARVLRYHKPVGEVCTRRDPEGRPTVFERLPSMRGRRWIAVGRLDASTSGLLLFTDDGELAHRLMHPSSEIEREYAVRVYGTVAPDALARLTSGVVLDDGPARFAVLTDAGGEGRNHWYHVIVREGRNRLVRRLWDSQGVEVSRLTRVRYGLIELPRRLRAGRWDELPPAEVAALCAAAGIAPAPPPRRQRDTPPRGRAGEARKPRR
jgi:23S rRNA pseudouridine2605 synthase